MKNIIFLFLTIFWSSFQFAQNNNQQFKEQFETAKKLLYDFQPEKALPILLDLYHQDPQNHNLEYLIGACYTDYQPKEGSSIQYLEKAKPFVVENYDAESYLEKGVSIHLYYFLAVAYAQNGRCEDAALANENFHTLIGQIGHAYLRDAQFWVDACNQLKNQAPPLTTPHTDIEPEPVNDDQIKNSKIVTQLIEYNTPAPLFGVQVGSFSKYLPSNSFDDIKNVEAFIDKNEKVRYVVGNFTFRNQAETLLKVLLESGYNDAFIVDVNKERKFSKKIVTVNDVSIKSQIRGKVHFRCQIGAFRDTIPEDMARKYLKVSGIKENIQNDMTLLSVGHFPTYEEAKLHIEELQQEEIHDAFVVAYNYDRKVPVKEAITYLSKQPKEEDKKRKK